MSISMDRDLACRRGGAVNYLRKFFHVRCLGAWLALVISMSAGADDGARQLRLKYLGAAGWELQADGVVVLIDPYISRIKYDGVRVAGDPRRDFALSDAPESDTALIDKIITRADFILVHHTHPDHAMDVPYIARKTGAKVIGTESARNLLRAAGVPDRQLYAVQGGEDYQFDRFSVQVIPSLHSALEEKRYFNSSRHGADFKGPLRLEHFIEGGSLMFLCRLNGVEVLTMGSMNFIENELRGLRPHVLLAGAGSSRSEIYKYTERLLTATGLPKIVIPTHWDDFYVPYENTAAQVLARKEKADPFVAEVAAASPRSRAIIPVHLETITIRIDP
jgi:L-ascorbate metabolism protein UlaG (beta-lactamase superfamily)